MEKNVESQDYQRDYINEYIEEFHQQFNEYLKWVTFGAIGVVLLNVLMLFLKFKWMGWSLFGSGTLIVFAFIAMAVWYLRIEKEYEEDREQYDRDQEKIKSIFKAK